MKGTQIASVFIKCNQVSLSVRIILIRGCDQWPDWHEGDWGWQESRLMASAASGARPGSGSLAILLMNWATGIWSILFIGNIGTFVAISIHTEILTVIADVCVVVGELEGLWLWLRKHNNGKLSTCWQPKLWSRVSLLGRTCFPID